jgi:two-component system, NarL family, response regulator NreC
MAITILLADDHDVVRESLRRMLEAHVEFSVVAEASDGKEAVDMAERQRPEVAVLDIGMKRMNGIEAAARISKCSPRTAILMLTVHNHPPYVTRAIVAGARGYLLKDSLDDEELTRAVIAVWNGGSYFSPSVASAVPDFIPPAGTSS